MARIIAGALSAMAIQPVWFVCWVCVPSFFLGQATRFVDVVQVSPLAALFAAPFVLLVGIPSVLILGRRRPPRWYHLAAIGFLAAALWPAVSLPGGDSGTSYGGNVFGQSGMFVERGKVTALGWLNYVQSLLIFGSHGVVGALAFYPWTRRQSQTGLVNDA